MAATEKELQEVAKQVSEVSKAFKSAKFKMDQLLSSNSAQAIDWTLQASRDALEDHPTNPTPYTAAEISNVIGSFSTYNSGHWEAGHGGNYELVTGTTPIV